MSVMADELVAGVRERANIERTKHISDAEIIKWLNDEGSALYNKLISARENYITRRTTLTLGGSSFVQEPSAEKWFNPDVTINNLTGDFAIPPSGSLLPAPSYYKILSFIGTPNAPCTTGDTLFQIKVNATLTDCMFTIADGSDAQQSDSAHNPTFTDADTLLVSTAAGAGADWSIYITMIVQPYLAETIANAAALPADFLKPLALQLELGNGNALPVEPLDSLNQRNSCETFKHWISDQRIYVYPERDVKVGPYTLDYCPRWTRLQITPFPNALLPEMEQFSDILEIGAAATAKLKRRMVEDAQALNAQQADMIRDAIAAIPGRKGGPKRIPMPTNERERFRGGYRYWRF